MDTIIENINDYVLGECSTEQCGFSDSEVNEIYATFAYESGEKVLENAVEALTDEGYDNVVEEIAKNIYKKRFEEQKESKNDNK